MKDFDLPKRLTRQYSQIVSILAYDEEQIDESDFKTALIQANEETEDKFSKIVTKFEPAIR